MTAPAVLRRWETAPTGALAGPPGAVLRDWVFRVRRVAPISAALLTVLMAHAGLAPHLSVRRAGPDVVLVAVVAVAVGRGARAGAGFGFAAGLGADLFLATPLGTAALALTVVGHGLGTATRPRSAPGAAAALCSPASSCFSCRTGRLHSSKGPEDRPRRARRRSAARRMAIRRSMTLTLLGVGAGRLATTAVATALAGVPFPGPSHLATIAASAALSAPLGPLAVAAVRRLPTPAGGPR